MISISGNSLNDLEEQLASLKRQVVQAGQQNPHEAMREKLIELKRRTTKRSGLIWRMISCVAARQQPCTLNELANELGLPSAASVHSLLAVLGRPCKRLNLTVIQNIGGNPTRYSISDDLRHTILELA